MSRWHPARMRPHAKVLHPDHGLSRAFGACLIRRAAECRAVSSSSDDGADGRRDAQHRRRIWIGVGDARRQQALHHRHVRWLEVAGDDREVEQRRRERRARKPGRRSQRHESDKGIAHRFRRSHHGASEGAARRQALRRDRERESARGKFVGMDSEMKGRGQSAEGTMHKTLILVGFAIASASLALIAQAPAATYTAAQAAAGRTTYQAQCASCHLPDLKGSGDAAPLVGSEFMGSWGRRSPRELLSFMQITMPPTRPGALSQEEYVNVAAFVLQQNGAPAGATALTPTVDAAINTIATGQAPAAAPQNAGGRGAAPAQAGQAGGGRGRGGPAVAAGITVEGEVKNFVPVTEAMRRNPDPSDWLMIRRDYHASDFSPLNQ